MVKKPTKESTKKVKKTPAKNKSKDYKGLDRMLVLGFLEQTVIK